MLTWDEVKQTIDEAMKVRADDFCLLVADYMPQNIVNELVEDHTRAILIQQENEDIRVEELVSLAANFMAGLQIGWFLARKAYHHEP